MVGSDGGIGLLSLAGGDLVVTGGTAGADATIGRGWGGFGTMTLANISELLFQGTGAFNGLGIGREGGTGTVILTTGSQLKAVPASMWGRLFWRSAWTPAATARST